MSSPTKSSDGFFVDSSTDCFFVDSSTSGGESDGIFFVNLTVIAVALKF